MAPTLFDKIWNKHVVCNNAGFPDILYIDVHLINKVTSAKAFEGLRKRNIGVLRPSQTLISKDATHEKHVSVSDLSLFQHELFKKNCSDFGLEIFEQNFVDQTDILNVLPGQILVFDQHQRNDMGAFGVLSICINDSLVEQVLATQCLLIHKPKRMKVEINGKLAIGLTAKDINHFLISKISAAGVNRYFIEYSGDTILNLNMEERIMICNMSREIGAMGGLIAPDEITLEYMCKHDMMPLKESEVENYSSWQNLYSDESSVFDEAFEFDAEDIGPGNYGIDLSKLMRSQPADEALGIITHDGAAILAGYNDTDYLLNNLESIEAFESSKIYKLADEA